MKKQLLSALALCGLLVSVNAQSFTNGDPSFIIDYSGSTSDANCLSGTGLAVPNDGGIYSGAGGNLTNVGEVQVGTEKFLKFTGASGTLDASDPPAFYDIYSNAKGLCASMRGDNVSIDMSVIPGISIKAKSDIDGAKLRIYIGTYGVPTYSTYNTGSGSSIIFEIPLTTSFKIYNFDFTALAANAIVWNAWDGTANTGSRSKINMIGFTCVTANANYLISSIEFGTVLSTNAAILPSSVKYGPNPSSSVINVTNFNVSSLKLIDLNGVVVRETASSNVSVEGLTSGLYFLQINGYKPVKVMVK